MTPAQFWQKLQYNLKTDCWEFPTKKKTARYGHLTVNYKNWLAHRYAYFLEHGEILDGMYVCHKCDNPDCCNPAHLFLGTPSDNAKDCIAKGRSRPDLLGANHPKGEAHPLTNLTEEQVLQIREMGASGLYTQREIGQLFGIARPTVSGILNRRRWTHI